MNAAYKTPAVLIKDLAKSKKCETLQKLLTEQK